MKSIKLAVSNVAWYPKEIDGFLRLLASLKCQGVELAASMLWDEPVEAYVKERLELRRKIEDRGLRLAGLQALFYSRKDLLLFKDERTRVKILEYLAELVELCADLGGKVLVFGSPRNRMIGDLPYQEAYKIAVDFFHKAGEQAGEHNIFLCVEPLGRTETDFVTSVAEAEKLIKDAGNPKGLGLHIDVKALIDEDEFSSGHLSESLSRAKHVHISDRNLMPPGSTDFDHRKIRAYLDKSKFSGFLSIEMKREVEDTEGAIRRAVEYVKKIYF